MKAACIFIAFGFLNCIASCGIIHPKHISGKFNLQGKIDAKKIKKIILNYRDNKGKEISDTVLVKKGEFEFSGFLKHPTYVEIIGNSGNKDIDYNNFANLFIEPGKMQITLEENNFSRFYLQGSKSQLILDSLRKKQQPTLTFFDSESKKILNLRDNTDNERYTLLKDSIIQELRIIEFRFIQEHPYSYIAPYFLHNHLSDSPLDSLKMIYLSWPKNIQNSRYGKDIANELRKKTISSLLVKAPNFEATTISGERIILSSFIEKKNVLLEFWASWCVPCRKSFGELKQTTSAHKDLIVIAISIDLQKNTWEKAINVDSTNMWLHVLAPTESKNNTNNDFDILSKYEIPVIPIQYLINKQGIIVGKWLGQSKENEDELRAKLDELAGLK